LKLFFFRQVTKKTVVRPNQRYQTIKEIVENRQFNEDKYLKEIGMNVEDEEMLIVDGRLIAPPDIKYISGRDGQSEVVERINIGKFVLKKLIYFINLNQFDLKMEYS
jgi:hypothetical protein